MHRRAAHEFENRMNIHVPIENRHHYVLDVISGVKYKGSKQSTFDEGILYCTPSLGKKGPPRYSAISFEDDDGDIRCGVLVAAVKVKVVGGHLDNTKVLLHVAEMKVDHH